MTMRHALTKEIKNIEKFIRKELNVNQYALFIEWLMDCYPELLWVTYPTTCIGDVRDVMLGWYDAKEGIERERYVEEMSTFLKNRIERCFRRAKEAEAKMSHFMYRHQPPTKKDREKENYSNAIVFKTLEWLDVIIEYRSYHEGYYYNQRLVDQWLINWLNNEMEK